MFQKTKPIRCKPLTDSAKGQDCVRCNRPDKRETVCARHYNGMWQLILGKGFGQKVHDFLVAYLCDDCDRIFTEGSTDFHPNEAERCAEFLYLCALSMNIWLRNAKVLRALLKEAQK